jgi:hypothetical protein
MRRYVLDRASQESNFGESTNSTTVYDIRISENPVSRENAFARIGISTNSTTRCAGICWMEPREEIVSKEWQFNHFNGVCNTHNSKIEVCQYLLLANQPFNHCLLHTYLWKSGFARKCFFEFCHINQFNH